METFNLLFGVMFGERYFDSLSHSFQSKNACTSDEKPASERVCRKIVTVRSDNE